MKYLQLSAKARERAFQDYLDFLPNDTWHEALYTTIIEELEKGWCENVELTFDIYSDNPGSIFNCSIDVEEFITNSGLTKTFPLIMYVIGNADSQDPYCEVYCDEDDWTSSVNEFDYHINHDISKYINPEIEALQTAMETWVDEQNKTILKRLQDEYAKVSTHAFFRNYNDEQEFEYNADGSLI